MSVKTPPAKLRVKSVDTGEICALGGLTPDVPGEAGLGKLWLIKKGTIAGAEKVRVNCYADLACTRLMFSSDWSNIYDISNLSTGYWYGWIRITFDRQFQNPTMTYYWAAEFTGYTRNGDTFYLGIPEDAPTRIYGDSGTRRLAFELFCYEDLGR